MQASILVNLWQKNALAGEIICVTTHLRSLQMRQMRQFLCLADSWITITLWQNHVFVVISVAADGLVLGARAFADTVLGKFRACTCSWIIPQRMAGDVSVTCAIISLWLMITHLTFQYSEFLSDFMTHVRMCLCVVLRWCHAIATPGPRYCSVPTRLTSDTGKFSYVVLRYVTLLPRFSLAAATFSYAVPRNMMKHSVP